MSTVLAFAGRLAWPLLAAVLVFALGFSMGDARKQRAWDAATQAQTAEALSTEREDRNDEFWRAARRQGVMDVHATTTAALRDAAAGDRADADRVRDVAGELARAVAASDPAAACRAERERISRLAGLLAEGAGLGVEGSGRTLRLDARVTALQGLAD